MTERGCRRLAAAVLVSIMREYQHAKAGSYVREDLRALMDSEIVRFWADASGLGDLALRKMREQMYKEV